jgi:drug/metabolite transporter (DMT)-like permease
MKAYLITTGVIFGLIAFLHLLKGIDERPRLATDPWYYLAMAGLGVLAAGLSAWAWVLLRGQTASREKSPG